jgi:hypothetical protein
MSTIEERARPQPAQETNRPIDPAVAAASGPVHRGRASCTAFRAQAGAATVRTRAAERRGVQGLAPRAALPRGRRAHRGLCAPDPQSR